MIFLVFLIHSASFICNSYLKLLYAIMRNILLQTTLYIFNWILKCARNFWLTILFFNCYLTLFPIQYDHWFSSIFWLWFFFYFYFSIFQDFVLQQNCWVEIDSILQRLASLDRLLHLSRLIYTCILKACRCFLCDTVFFS